jgi:hypothetical protein
MPPDLPERLFRPVSSIVSEDCFGSISAGSSRQLLADYCLSPRVAVDYVFSRCVTELGFWFDIDDRLLVLLNHFEILE